ncbi:MAG TPA: sugar transferase [Candidatus Acidoferrales bacterium]|jgi:exopolysaccharide biosynthesis polyprenyl glycosylphosphotransferase|nr:sugar transferase [Candidatus Acidoferrales bacterium]
MRSLSKQSDRRRGWTDAFLALGIALAIAVYANGARIPTGGLARFLQARITVLNALFAGFFMLAWTSCFAAVDSYRAASLGAIRKLLQIVQGCAAMTLALAAYLFLSHTKGPTTRIAATFFAASLAYEIFRAAWVRRIACRDPQVVVILGSGRRAGKAWRQIRIRHHSMVKLLGFVDDRPVEEMAPDIAARYLGEVTGLSALLLRNRVDELLIAVPMKSCYEMAQRAVSIAEEVGVQIAYMQDMYASGMKQSPGDRNPFLELVPTHEHYLARQAVKRAIDILGAAVALCLLSPLFVLIAAAIKLTSRGPVFFVQPRYGYRRRLFRMYKFRSMVQNAPELMAQLEQHNEAAGPIFKIRRDPRVTPLGKLLRTSSLDELPQLWNVLIGNMSLVGPRPMSVRDVSRFGEAALMRRFTVKPGITGLWQVSGRSAVGFDRWIQLDYSYIDDWSLSLDFRILARTVGAVVRRTGAA